MSEQEKWDMDYEEAKRIARGETWDSSVNGTWGDLSSGWDDYDEEER